jgi:predicted enzyme related to lactoylglutathione lyase
MTTSTTQSVILALVPALVGCASSASDDLGRSGRPAPGALDPEREQAMQVHYLELVTPDVDATCDALEKLHGVSFGAPEAALGNARTATLNGGGLLGVRAPMRADEEPVVRPYVLVDDIDAAVEAAQAAGAEIALPPMEIPGRGKCAIYFQGGIQHGLWQL